MGEIILRLQDQEGEEVDELYRRYLKSHSKPAFSREDLAKWYDGYHMEDGYSMYNPNSVVRALTRNKLNNYWTKAGEYVELKDYVLRFQGKIGEQPKTAGRIILVGIGYYRKDKVHRCRIEMLEPGLPA